MVVGAVGQHGDLNRGWQRALSCGSRALMRSTTWMILAPGCRWILTITAGALFIQAACLVFSAPSTACATSLSMTGAPLRYATTTELYLAAAVFLRLRSDYLLATAAERAKSAIPLADQDNERIPERCIEALAAKLEPGEALTGGQIAQRLLSVWKRMRNIPPSLRVAVGLSAAYLGFLLLGVGAPMVIFAHAAEEISATKRIESRSMPDGSRRQCAVFYQGGKTAGWSALSEDGTYDGPAEEMTRGRDGFPCGAAGRAAA